MSDDAGDFRPIALHGRISMLEAWRLAEEQHRLTRDQLENERRRLDDQRYNVTQEKLSKLDSSHSALNAHLLEQDKRGSMRDDVLNEIAGTVKKIELKLAGDDAADLKEKEISDLDIKHRADHRASQANTIALNGLFVAILACFITLAVEIIRLKGH